MICCSPFLSVYSSPDSLCVIVLDSRYVCSLFHFYAKWYIKEVLIDFKFYVCVRVNKRNLSLFVCSPCYVCLFTSFIYQSNS